MTGLEPACLAALEPKSSVSANSTTSAFIEFIFFQGILATRLPIPPVAVPDIFLAAKASASAIDRCHSRSIAPPATGGARFAPHIRIAPILTREQTVVNEIGLFCVIFLDIPLRCR